MSVPFGSVGGRYAFRRGPGAVLQLVYPPTLCPHRCLSTPTLGMKFII